MITACINCLDRHIACHDTCPKYQEQHKKELERKRQIIDQKCKEYGTTSDRYARRQRMKTGYPGKVFKSNKKQEANTMLSKEELEKMVAEEENQNLEVRGMCEVLGYKNFCSACKGSQKENGELVCREQTTATWFIRTKGGYKMDYKKLAEIIRRFSNLSLIHI